MRANRKPLLRLILVMLTVSVLPHRAVLLPSAREWTLEAANATADGHVRLGFGLAETDDTSIRFSCAPESNVLDMIIFHTQQRMKRGSPATARLLAGRTRWPIRGTIRANDESLDESFTASVAFDAARFMRLAEADQLQFSVGRGTTQTAQLAGSGEKFRQFSLLCAKPRRNSGHLVFLPHNR